MGESRDAAQRFYDAFNRGDLDEAIEMFAANCEHHEPVQGTIPDNDRFKEHLQVFKRAMPDATINGENYFEAGDTVAIEGRFKGTHSGPFASPQGDIPATNKTLDMRFSDFMTIRDGKVASHRVYFDQVDMLGQLGLM
jgi:steroid delta-isomerase-like uncharacterized protein